MEIDLHPSLISDLTSQYLSLLLSSLLFTSSNMSKNVFKLRAKSLKLKAFKGFSLFASGFPLKRGE